MRRSSRNRCRTASLAPRWDELERDALPELRARPLGQVDDAHAAVAELADDAERAGELRHGRRRA
jgi:hypothetical protein